MVMKSETFLDKMFEFQQKAHIHPENFTILLKQLIIGMHTYHQLKMPLHRVSLQSKFNYLCKHGTY